MDNMEEKKNIYKAENVDEEALQLLRGKGVNEAESPVVGRDFWGPKEISIRRSKWIVRGLIILLMMIFIGETYFLSKVQKESPDVVAHFQGGPTQEIIPAPAIKVPLQAPPIDSVNIQDDTPETETEYPAPPTPTPPPLPSELLDQEIPPPDL